MNAIASHRRKHLLAAVVGAALMAACADRSPVAPDGAAAARLEPSGIASAAASPELGSCDRLRAPEGSSFAYHAYARGAQIYRWNGQEWLPVGPSAELYADAGGKALVGTHFGGPRWQSLSGSTVRGEVIDRCVHDANAVPWLTLKGIPESGPGVFAHTTFIQRVNTTGGKAPANAGTVGEVRAIPYAAEYFFYRPL